MDPWQDLKTWSKRHREEALHEARGHHLADRAGTRRALAGLSSGLTCSRWYMEWDSQSNPAPLGKDAR